MDHQDEPSSSHETTTTKLSKEDAIILLETQLKEISEKALELYADKKFDKAEELGYACACISGQLKALKATRDKPKEF